MRLYYVKVILLIIFIFAFLYGFCYGVCKQISKLLSTKNLVLEEGNTWGDEFWGINLKTGKGENHLGKILMKVRKELNENPK